MLDRVAQLAMLALDDLGGVARQRLAKGSPVGRLHFYIALSEIGQGDDPLKL